MAGRKQHYIPQILLRGFEIARRGNISQVAVYKYGSIPYVTSTQGVAAERDFYSGVSADEAATLDDLITTFERDHFNPALFELRGIKTGAVNARAAAMIIVHLAFRAAHIRLTLQNMADGIGNHIDGLLEDQESARSYLDIDSLGTESLVALHVETEIKEFFSSGVAAKDKEIISRLCRFLIREKFANSLAGVVPKVRDRLRLMRDELPRIVEKAHLESLTRSLAPEVRVAQLEGLSWSISSVQGERYFVLPDCLAIAGGDQGGAVAKPYLVNDESEVYWVAMPISSTQVLIGAKGGFQPDISILNKNFARCSLDFFVSSKNDQDGLDLAAHIGGTVADITNDVVANSIAEKDSSCHQYIEQKSESHTSSMVAVRVPPGTYRAAEIQSAIQAIFSVQCGHNEAGRLDEIIITSEIIIDISSVRGRALNPNEVQEVMVGSVEPVVIEGRRLLRLFVPLQIASLLLQADDDQNRQLALLTLRHSFGRVTCLDLWMRKYSAIESEAENSLYKKLGIEFACKFSSHYFGARVSMLYHPGFELDEAASKFISVAAAIFPALHAARTQFKVHQDVDRLLMDVCILIDMLFVTTSSVCGSYAGQGRKLTSCSGVRPALAVTGFWNWLCLFERDLDRHFDTCRASRDDSEYVLILAQNFERVLWQFGIFLSESEGGLLWVDVCDDAKLDGIRALFSSWVLHLKCVVWLPLDMAQGGIGCRSKPDLLILQTGAQA